MRPPKSSELSTFYKGIKNDDSVEQILRILGIKKSLYRGWKRKAKKVQKKKRRGEDLTREEKRYLRLLKLSRRADQKKRGWE